MTHSMMPSPPEPPPYPAGAEALSPLPGVPDDDDAPLYFLHIPKTAGTTLYNNLDDRFEVDEICPVRFIADLIQLPPEAFQPCRFFRGHFGYSLQHFVDRPLRYITVLRDPIERCISQYEDVRRVPNNFLHRRVTDQRMSFADFVRDPLCNVTLSNFQARNLAFDWRPEQMRGNEPLIKRGIAGTPLDLSEDELRAIALKRLRACVAVGVVERFNAFTALLSYRFAWYPIQPSRRLNQSSQRLRREDLDADTLAQLHHLNGVDLALYEEATRLFEAQYQAMTTQLGTEQSDPAELWPLLEQHYADHEAQRTKGSSVVNFSVRRPVAGANWYGREGLEPGCTPFRWTGPGTTSTLHLPLQAEGDLRLHLRIVRAIAPDLLDRLTLAVNDQPVPLTPLTQWEGNAILKAVIPQEALASPPALTRLSLTVNRTDSMQTLAPHTPDQRQVGVAVSQVYVFPDGAIAPADDDLNLFPDHDPHWMEVLAFLQAHLKPHERLGAPKEFVQPFPSRFCDYGQLAVGALPEWVAIAKHLAPTLAPNLLRTLTTEFRPVFCNPVFLVVANRTDLPRVSWFSDAAWAEAADFLEARVQPQDTLVAPPDFVYGFPHALDLDTPGWMKGLPSAPESPRSPAWVMLHKGTLDTLDTATLQAIVKDLRPVFANLVFVIFSSRRDLRAIPWWATHMRPFWKVYYRRRWHQVL